MYSFDPDGLELAWNERVVCQTGNGQELGRVVKGNHEELMLHAYDRDETIGAFSWKLPQALENPLYCRFIYWTSRG